MADFWQDFWACLDKRPRFSPQAPDASRLLRFFGDRQPLAAGTTPTIGVVGTAGKGTVAHFCARLLQGSGLFLSPHLLDPQERVSIAGAFVRDEALGRAFLEHLAADDAGGRESPLTAFEAMTAWAAYAFGRLHPEGYVVEAGIGGGGDPARFFRPLLLVLTGVDYEHQDLLGHSLQEIEAEKLAFGARRSLVLRPAGDRVLYKSLTDGRRLEAPCWQAAAPFRVSLGADLAPRTEGTLIRRFGSGAVQEVALALPSLMPKAGLSLALALEAVGYVRRLPERVSDLEPSDFPADALVSAAAVLLKGRGECVKRTNKGCLLADVAHTPQAVKAFLEAVLVAAAPLRPSFLHIMLALSGDKDPKAILMRLQEALSGAAAGLRVRLSLCAHSHRRTADPLVLADHLRQIGPLPALRDSVAVFQDPAACFRQVRDDLCGAPKRAAEGPAVHCLVGSYFFYRDMRRFFP